MKLSAKAATIAVALISACGAMTMPALAAEYTLVVYESQSDFAARTDPARAQAYWASYAAFGEAAQKAGIMRGGSPLEPAVDGGVVSPAPEAGKIKRLKAAPPTGPLQISGYFVIEAKDLDEAMDWASRLPAARSTRVEVRPNIAMMAR